MNNQNFILAAILSLAISVSAFAAEPDQNFLEKNQEAIAGLATVGIGGTDLYVHAKERIRINDQYDSATNNASEALDDLLTVRDRRVRKLAPELSAELDKTRIEERKATRFTPDDNFERGMKQQAIKDKIQAVVGNDPQILDYDRRIQTQYKAINDLKLVESKRLGRVMPAEFQKPATKATLKAVRGAGFVGLGVTILIHGALTQEKAEEFTAPQAEENHSGRSLADEAIAILGD